MISVIIPVYNEESILRANIDYFRSLDAQAEVIFVDGGSDDGTCLLIESFARVVYSSKGRALQMNRGAEEASHDILLFLHADTKINSDALEKVEVYIRDRHYIGGCFTQVIDRPGILYRWIAWTGNVRAKVSKVFYGDQGIFVRKDIFEKIGRFPSVDICEDVYFTKKLRECGEVDIFPERIFCSARRWVKQGVLKTYIANVKVKFGMLLKLNQKRLVNVYRDIR